MGELVLTAVICGAKITKEQNPAIPYTVDEIIREAKSAYDAGAAVIYVHVCEDDGMPTQSKARFKEALDAIYEVIPNVIIIPSTGGAIGMTAEEYLQPTELMLETATLDCGTYNFSGGVFENTIPMMRAFGKRMIKNKIKPEYECFEMGHLGTILRLTRRGEVPGDPMQLNLMLDAFGYAPATADSLAWLVNNIPADSTWTAAGISRHKFSLVAVAIDMGDRVRIGSKDNLYLSKGVLAESNGELVAKAARITHELDHGIADPAGVHRILSLAPRH